MLSDRLFLLRTTPATRNSLGPPEPSAKVLRDFKTQRKFFLFENDGTSPSPSPSPGETGYKMLGGDTEKSGDLAGDDNKENDNTLGPDPYSPERQMIRTDEDCEKMTKNWPKTIDNKGEESEIDDNESTKTNMSKIGLDETGQKKLPKTIEGLTRAASKLYNG